MELLGSSGGVALQREQMRRQALEAELVNLRRERQQAITSDLCGAAAEGNLERLRLLARGGRNVSDGDCALLRSLPPEPVIAPLFAASRPPPPAQHGRILRSGGLGRGADGDGCPGADDKRTALHLAASEGRAEAVVCLVEELGALPSPVDRWG